MRQTGFGVVTALLLGVGKNRRMLSVATTNSPDPSQRRAWLSVGLVATLGAGAVCLTAGMAFASYFASRVVTPDPPAPADTELLALSDDGQIAQFRCNDNTLAPGKYGYNSGTDDFLMVVSDIVTIDVANGTVWRRVDAVLRGDPHAPDRGHWSGSVFDHPNQLHVSSEDIVIESVAGRFPAWRIPPLATAQERAEPTWAIVVHGRGASRTEGLRAVHALASEGLTSLLISYRNDAIGTRADRGRYGLGATEWHEVDAAISYALRQGARQLVLVGYSMGGAISLQALLHSTERHRIRALILDAPVVNWLDVLRHQAKENHVPAPVRLLSEAILSTRFGSRLAGLSAPIDLDSLNWVKQANELKTPTLIVHSLDDDFVPVGPSEELAERNPELVTFEAFNGAAHTREWNVSTKRWDDVVSRWLSRVLAPGV